MHLRFGIKLVDGTDELDLSMDMQIESESTDGSSNTYDLVQNEIVSNPADFVTAVADYVKGKFLTFTSATVTEAVVSHDTTVYDLQVP